MARKLSLTFDNGPDPAVTPQVLADLAARGLPATFFPVGERLAEPGGSATLDQVAAAGHAIGNHTFSHPRPFGALTPAAAIAEIQRTEALLAGRQSPGRLFRPSAGGGLLQPGVLNQGIVDYLVAERFSLVLWSLVVEDWARPDGSWVEIALTGLKRDAWTNLVLHDIPNGAMDHLGRFLDLALAEGVEVAADLPPATVPIHEGRIRGPVQNLLAG